jgi:hypothetical protein
VLGQTVTNPEVATIAASTGLPDDPYSLFNSGSPTPQPSPDTNANWIEWIASLLTKGASRQNCRSRGKARFAKLACVRASSSSDRLVRHDR